MGTISNKNTRYSLTIDKLLKGDLEVLATKESRTLNSLMIAALKKYLEVEGEK